MKDIKSKYFVFLLLYLPLSCNFSNPECTDQHAGNYGTSATEDDHSCIDDTIFISAQWSIELNEQIKETSGLILWDGALWTINDDTDTRLYALDTTSGEIIADYVITDVLNRNWEEISQDKEFIYIGDFGNNMGERRDLHILRIDKLSLKSGNPSVDTIWFTFSDQHDFVSNADFQTEFDCEAFVVSSDSIYLFTKQWATGYTTQYALSKFPGSYTAQRRNTFNSKGLVTGATFLENERLLVLCGYSGLAQTFLYLFYDYPNDDFFAGSQKRVNIQLHFHQVEGVTARNTVEYYISNESFRTNQFVKVPQKLHLIDLSEIKNLPGIF